MNKDTYIGELVDARYINNIEKEENAKETSKNNGCSKYGDSFWMMIGIELHNLFVFDIEFIEDVDIEA